MREDNSNWFAKWEEELPSPEELIPLSQTLITPDLAMAFDIPINPYNNQPSNSTPPPPPPPPPPPVQSSSSLPKSNSSEFDSADLGSGSDDPARTLKRPRLVWTPQLHKRFVDAVAHLGIKNAVPKTIMQLMSVDGLTRENVASHLQKYRLYLKRMQGGGTGGGGGGGGGGGPGFPATGDPTTDHLFASSPVPAHFLHPCNKPNSNNFMQFMPPVSKLLQQQMSAPAPVAVGGQHSHSHSQLLHPPQLQQPYRQMGHYFGSPPQFEYSFMNNNNYYNNRVSQGGVRMGAPLHTSVPPSSSSYIDDEMEAPAHGRKKVLALFPAADH